MNAVTEKIGVGSRVRSYDFDGSKDCYIEGTVEAIVPREGTKRYKITVERDVWAGVESPAGEAGSRVGKTAYPPVNGTPTFRGETNYVEAL